MALWYFYGHLVSFPSCQSWIAYNLDFWGNLSSKRTDRLPLDRKSAGSSPRPDVSLGCCILHVMWNWKFHILECQLSSVRPLLLLCCQFKNSYSWHADLTSIGRRGKTHKIKNKKKRDCCGGCVFRREKDREINRERKRERERKKERERDTKTQIEREIKKRIEK
jgi:hypothetical protein